MSRTKGVLSFSGNFEPELSAPFDARMTAQLKSDLSSSTVWESLSGEIYAYAGMLTVVYGDTEENNGLYRLINLPVTNESNWLKVDKSLNELDVYSKNEVDATFATIENLDGVALYWKGAFDKSLSYSVNDIVYYDGNSYVCYVDYVGSDDETGLSLDYFSILAQKGYDGVDGDTIAEVNIDETGNLIVSYASIPELTVFDGTQNQWDALTDDEKSAYNTVYIYEDDV